MLSLICYETAFSLTRKPILSIEMHRSTNVAFLKSYFSKILYIRQYISIIIRNYFTAANLNFSILAQQIVAYFGQTLNEPKPHEQFQWICEAFTTAQHSNCSHNNCSTVYQWWINSVPSSDIIAPIKCSWQGHVTICAPE